RGNGRIVAAGDGAEGIPQREVALEVRGLGLRRAAPPVVRGHTGHASGLEMVREDARLHRAVADDPGAARSAPRDLALARVAPDERERRLQRVDVAHGFA